MRFWLLCSLLLSFSAHAAGQCDPRAFLNLLIQDTPETQARNERLKKLANSKYVLESLNDRFAAAKSVYEKVADLKAEQGLVRFELSDGELSIDLAMVRDQKSIRVIIHSLNLPGKAFGENPAKIQTAFFKFTGALLHGLDENLQRFPGKISTVTISGKKVVNERLANALKGLGFSRSADAQTIIANAFAGNYGSLNGVLATGALETLRHLQIVPAEAGLLLEGATGTKALWLAQNLGPKAAYHWTLKLKVR